MSYRPDYYAVLGVEKNATLEKIKREYKSLALKWHPDRNTDNVEEATKKFKEIAEAYEVLSNEEKRKIYDKYGHEGLSPSSPSSHDYPFHDPFFVFEELFSNSGFFGDGLNGFTFRTSRSGRGGRQLPPLKLKLSCSLSQLYIGHTKKVSYSKLVVEASGFRREVTSELTVHLKPGYATGTTLTFAQQGNQQHGLLPGDLVLVVEQKPHPTFRREGDDLHYTTHITVVSALMGSRLQITHLDDKRLDVNVPLMIDPAYVHRVEGMGMPVRGGGGDGVVGYGDLYVHFKLLFPKRLSDKKREEIKKAFEGVEFQKPDPGVWEALWSGRVDVMGWIRKAWSVLFMLFCMWWVLKIISVPTR